MTDNIMEYFSKKVLLIGIIMTMLLVACEKDNEGYDTVQEVGNSEVFGFVFNSANQPILGARVTFQGITAFTDKDGVYRLRDVKIGQQHNGLKIVKEGYFEGSRSFRTSSSSILFQTTILEEKSFNHSFQSTLSTEIIEGPVTIKFPANAIVFEDSGLAYEGDVLVAISQIDPTENQWRERMPGDLTAIEDGNTLTTLESFGMVYVEMQDPSGAKLQIAENKTVELSYRIATSLRGAAPATIDMWSFDFELGAWKKEGQATKTSDGVRYIGEVSHFSCWNYDVSAPSVVLNGQVVSGLVGLGNVDITLLNASNKGGRGKTDYQGRFSGRVEAEVPLTLTVSDTRGCGLNFSIPVGPFDEDTDIGIIEVGAETETIPIQGVALDCDQNPIAIGKIYIENVVLPITDGVIDIVVPFCTSITSADIRIVDENRMKEVLLLSIPVEETIDLGDVIVCEEGLSLTVDNLNSDPILLSEPLVQTRFNNFNNLSRATISSGPGLLPFAEFSFLLGQNLIDTVAVGQYELTEAIFDNGTDRFTLVDNPTGSVTVESAETSFFGVRIEGSYSIDTQSANGEERIITGSFKVNVK